MKLLLAILVLASVVHADVGPWCGAVTPTSAVVKIKSPATVLTCDGQTVPATRQGDIATFQLTDLQPDHAYEYRVGDATGSFRTFPTGAVSFAFAFGSCGKSSRHPVYTAIEKAQPLFYLNLGDWHYSDIATNDPALYRQVYEERFAGSSLYRHVPFIYVWDDHDYGPNDSDKTSPSRDAARQVYREYIPHYPLPDDGAIYQTFEVGRVKFIVTDLRSERTPNKAVDSADKSMLGEKQKAWFKRELLAARDRYPLVFWVNSVTWVGKPVANGDQWFGFTAERRELANFFKENQIKNLCILTGDAHMTSADDGSNGDFADGGGAPVPQLMSSPLDRPGSTKGGPYSHGVYVPGNGEGMYGLVTVTDTGAKITVRFSGRNHLDVEKVVYEFSRAAEVPSP